MARENVIGYYTVSSKEQVYYTIRLTISIVVYILLVYGAYSYYSGDVLYMLQMSALLIPVIIMILLLYILKNGLFVGLIKCYGVKLNEEQLPEIYKTVRQIATGLDIKQTPDVYLLQAGGSLNAFAKKFFNSNYIVIYSDLLEAHFQGDKDAVEFVIAHEMGHIKRSHFFKELLLAPSIVIPFLPQAYYRGCELTCDNIGKFFNSKGASNGLLMLAGGKGLYKKLNMQEYKNQSINDSSFWRWLAEKFLSHPNLYKRLINVQENAMPSGKVITEIRNESETLNQPLMVEEKRIKQIIPGICPDDAFSVKRIT